MGVNIYLLHNRRASEHYSCYRRQKRDKGEEVLNIRTRWNATTLQIVNGTQGSTGYADVNLIGTFSNIFHYNYEIVVKRRTTQEFRLLRTDKKSDDSDG